LVESTKAMCEIIKILEKRFYEVTKQTNDRQKKNNNNVKKMERAILDMQE